MRKFGAKLLEVLRKGDMVLLALCVLTSVFGIVMVAASTAYDGSSRYVIIQTGALITGILLYLALTAFDIDILAGQRTLLFLFNTAFLAMLLVWGIRDLVEKYKIRNKSEFTNISEFMMDNIGNLLSPNNISKTLKNDQSEITRKTVSKYIGYLENAFLFYEAKRYDLKGKKYLANNSKYYLCDTSFRYAVNGTRNMDFGRVYENIVYLELRRRGYEVYVGKLYKKEVDFVAKKREAQIYIQVSDNISDEKTFEREYSPLLAIRDAYPKMIIARTHHEIYDYKGVQVVDICRWLRE